MQDYKKLKIWVKSKDLSVLIYKITQDFPKEEKFGLTNQIRRCATSIPANIAEGCGRNTKKDFAQFINISIGSINELETYFIIAKELNLLNEDIANNLLTDIVEVRKMLFSFINKVRIETDN